MLPRIIGQGRASELLYTGRALGGEEGERWGFFNRLVDPARCSTTRWRWRRDLAAGPTFANGITKTMLHQEWAMTIEQAIEAEAQAQGWDRDRIDATQYRRAGHLETVPHLECNATGAAQ